MAIRRAMVLLPLPLSPTRATISFSWMTRSMPSTPCSRRRERKPPSLKCLVKPTVRSSSVPGSRAGRSAMVIEEEAAHEVLLARVELRGLDAAARHHLRAARVEPAPGRRASEVRRAAGDAGQRLQRSRDGGKRAHQADRVWM